MKYFYRFIIFVIVTGGVVYYLVWIKGLNLFGSGDQDIPVAVRTFSSKAPVDVMVLESQLLENKINTTGTILPREAVSVRSEIAGRVTKIHFEGGQRVKKDDLLFELNRKELLAQLKRLEQIIDVRKDREKRYKDLLKVGGTSFESYETAKAELDLTISDATIIEAQLEKMSVLAPFDGILGFRKISEGAFVSPEVEVTQLFHIDTVIVQFSVPGKYSKDITVGKSISFMIQGSEVPKWGKVFVKEPSIAPETRMLPIRAYAPNRNLTLMPGQFVNITVILDTFKEAILVPAETVIPDEDGNKVFIVKNGHAETRRVRIGARTEKNVHILSGLGVGDSLIVTGLMRVNPGTELDIKGIN